MPDDPASPSGLTSWGREAGSRRRRSPARCPGFLRRPRSRSSRRRPQRRRAQPQTLSRIPPPVAGYRGEATSSFAAAQYGTSRPLDRAATAAYDGLAMRRRLPVIALAIAAALVAVGGAALVAVFRDDGSSSHAAEPRPYRPGTPELAAVRLEDVAG